MDKLNAKIETTFGCWLVAFAIGAIAAIILWVFTSWGFFLPLFIGLLLMAVVGVILSNVMSRPLPSPNEQELTTPNAPSAGDTSAATSPAPKPVVAPAPSSKAAAADAPSKAQTEAKPAANKAPAKKTAPKKKAKPAAASDERPAMMTDAPEGGQAGDLKLISGVGPKLEQTLNDLGIWHYAQVAQFKKKDIAWVDERLRFKGRIERDDWVSQAKELAKGKS